MFADWVKLMAFSGARRSAALNAQWRQVDWVNRQLHLFEKGSKDVVVDFNPYLEAHLKDMLARRLPVGPNAQPTEYLFPSVRPGARFAEGPMNNFSRRSSGSARRWASTSGRTICATGSSAWP